MTFSYILFFTLLICSTEQPQELKPYPDGSFIQVEGTELSVKVIKGTQATTQTFSLTDFDVLESRSDSSAFLLARNATELKQGKNPYVIYLPLTDCELLNLKRKDLS